VQQVPQRKTTPVSPRGLHGATGVYAYWITITNREAYGVQASDGIRFGHESQFPGETLVTRGITHAVARRRRPPP
jgi:GDPmannose 4,6-dehydratase